MPPVIPQHFLDAKKRMKMGLHPAVLAAVQRSVEQAKRGIQQPSLAEQTFSAFNRGEIPLSLGAGVNQGHARTVAPGGDMRAAMDPLAGQRYRAMLQRTQAGQLQEVHDYGGGRRMVFTRQPSQSLIPRITAANPNLAGQTLNQQLSNSATAEDKMLALAHRAAAGQLAQRVGSKRRFSRNPGPMQRY
jgi:hypothetical protein